MPETENANTPTRYAVTCQTCGHAHEATPSHEGQWGQGQIYAVVCPTDSLTDYYTAETVVAS